MAAAPTTKPSICLCMIVKNEATVIRRCLDSVREHIDTWVISDTGSTDGTQDLVRAALASVPGELVEEPWVDFGTNRTRNLHQARGKADYLLLLDADMVLHASGPLPQLTADSYMLTHLGELAYRNKRLIRDGSLDWRYVGATHEYLAATGEGVPENLEAWAVEHFADGGSRADKFVRDARLLSTDLERDPDNPRTVFYLAQTMRDLGRTREATELYERRAAMDGWAEETYYALLQVGILKSDSGDWPGGMQALIRAWESRPERLEACYELVSRLRQRGEHRTAHALAAAVLDQPAPADWLFVHPWVYDWGLLFEYSITAYWTGAIDACLQACDRLLSRPDLPRQYRDHTQANKKYAEAALSNAATSR